MLPGFRRLATLLAVVAAFSACDSQGSGVPTPPDEVAPEAPLRTYETAAFGGPGSTATGRPFGAALHADGSIRKSAESGSDFGAYLSGLWLGGHQDGQARANVVWYGYGVVRSNFSAACGADGGGLFALDADTTYTATEAWPHAAGAPTNADGSPRVYGDRMLWGSFCPTSVPSTPYFTSPFQGLRVNTAVYAYDREDLSGVRFVRYEITSTGTSPLNELRVGYFSDTDSPSASTDAVGFDAPLGLSYVYNLGKRDDGTYWTDWVSGFAFLETPKGAPLRAHRIMRKNHYYDPEFGETGVTSVEQLIDALDGLSNDGDPMVDPTIGTPTAFAFTGDPFAGTGWLDGRFNDDGSYSGVDVRHLSSTGVLSLAPGETVTFTVVWVTERAGTPGVSHFEVARTLAAVRAEPSLWQF